MMGPDVGTPRSPVAAFGDGFADDPFGALRELRETSPVFAVEGVGWVVTRYDEVVSICRDPLLWSSRTVPGVVGRASAASAVLAKGHRFKPTLISSDPPEHRRYRALVGTVFTPRRVAAMQPRITEVVAELLDRIVRTGSAELVRDFAVPLPMTIISEQLGVPVEDMDKFKIWSDALSQPLSGQLSEDEQEACAHHALALQQYLTDRIEERRSHPRQDILTQLLAARVEGDRPLDLPELLSICTQLLVAGNETTTRLIAGCIHLLCTNPDQGEQLKRDPDLIGAAIEETLRLESPVQALFRVATRDTILGGRAVRAGERAVLHIGAANRDDREFSDPDTFDLHRSSSRPHLAFGHGAHFCIGASLARSEAGIAVLALLERLPNLRTTTMTRDPNWRERSITSLGITFDS